MTIKKLSPFEIQKIAAGEVVERPAHIIKELVENSIDAGATQITIAVQEGGKKNITVQDNGCGMDRSDAHLCFELHTTSKISSFDDLTCLGSFGFRGEALASIAAISTVTLTTKTQTATHALQLILEGGKLIKETAASSTMGTKLEITQLFENIPVRKKFLKTTSTEWNAILTLFKAFALAYPNLHLQLEHNKNQVFNCPPVATYTERMEQLYEEKLHSQLITLVPSQTELCTIEGVITSPHYHRYDRQGIYFFVNKRWVKNYELSRALLKGYANVLPKQMFPATALSLTIPTAYVDINVHPKKEEVVFLYPRKLEQQLAQAVQESLEQYVSSKLTNPSTAPHNFPYPQQAIQNAWHIPSTPRNLAPSYQPNTQLYTDPFDTPNEPMQAFKNPLQEPEALYSNDALIQKSATIMEDQTSFHQDPLQEISIKGQLFNTYILVQQGDELIMIDQHAAHERILYEYFEKNLTSQETVALLFPTSYSLSVDDQELIAPFLPLFKEHGFLLEPFGPTTLLLKTTPIFAKHVNIHDTLDQVIGWIKEMHTITSKDIFKKVTEKLRAQLACKAAIKAGDILTQEKTTELLKNLASTSNRFSCPHGRPTQWVITQREIEKKFKRII